MDAEEEWIRIVRASIADWPGCRLRPMLEDGRAVRVCVAEDMGEYGRGVWARQDGGEAVCENGTAPVVWLDQATAEKVIAAVLGTLRAAVIRGGGLRLRGLGKFYARGVAPRQRVVPLGGRLVDCRASGVLAFQEAPGFVVGMPIALGTDEQMPGLGLWLTCNQIQREQK
jgi:nucleoid DNA-binding protein